MSQTVLDKAKHHAEVITKLRNGEIKTYDANKVALINRHIEDLIKLLAPKQKKTPAKS